METKINFDTETDRELVASKFDLAIATKLQAFKTDNKICLPMALDQSVVIEMELNEDKEEKIKRNKNQSSNKSEMYIALPLFCFMVLIILAAIGLLVYFYIAL